MKVPERKESPITGLTGYGGGLSSFISFGNIASVEKYIDDVFSTYLYTGNDSTQTITNEIDLEGKGGMVWVKTRNEGYTASYMDHAIVDTVRGDRILSSNSSADDTTWGTPSGYFPSFNSDGFTVGSLSLIHI